MSSETHPVDEPAMVEMPKPTAAPLVLAAGIVLLAMGVATSFVFLFAGAVVFVAGLGAWIAQMLPGRGNWLEPLAQPSHRAQPIGRAPGPVEQLRPGAPGYRLRLPVTIHPVSAGIKGGIVGGLVMPIPALAYGVLSGLGIWWPVNLLAGMVFPGVATMSDSELAQFHPTLFVAGVVIHVAISLVLGLLYGILMPTLPKLAKPIAWGALLMPLLWTAASFVALGIMNPAVRVRIEWPWFVISQLVFGIVAAIMFTLVKSRGAVKAGLLAGIAGGVLMPIPALLWSLASGHGIWYPINLLSAMAIEHGADLSTVELEQFRSDWFIAALVVHAILSLSFGLAFSIVLPRVPEIPAPLAWGGLLLPLLWTSLSYGLMGVVNPVLQERVDWPWFIVSQFVFGIAAAIVVVRSEQVHIPPAGGGPNPPTRPPASPATESA